MHSSFNFASSSLVSLWINSLSGQSIVSLQIGDTGKESGLFFGASILVLIKIYLFLFLQVLSFLLQ